MKYSNSMHTKRVVLIIIINIITSHMENDLVYNFGLYICYIHKLMPDQHNQEWIYVAAKNRLAIN